MHKRRLAHVALVFVAACSLAQGLRAQEPDFDPWAGAPDPQRLMPGRAMPEEQRGDTLARSSDTHLRRCRMNALESAQYSATELQLEKSDPKAAVATLEALLAANPGDDLRDTTQFNLAEIFRRRLHDAEGAAAHYRQVAGALRASAAERLLAMLAETGKADEVAKAAEELLAKAEEKGEKLALLHRLALIYRHNSLPDRALAVYQRITKEFTPDDLKQILAAIEREAAATIEKLQAAAREGDPETAEALHRRLRDARPRQLREAGRWDELFAYERARNKGFQRFEREERGRQAAERERQGAEPEPPRPAPRGEPRPPGRKGGDNPTPAKQGDF